MAKSSGLSQQVLSAYKLIYRRSVPKEVTSTLCSLRMLLPSKPCYKLGGQELNCRRMQAFRSPYIRLLACE